jgi:phage terminase large subunit-like protein
MRGFVQSSAMKKLEIMATAEELEHFNNPVVKWSLNNTIAKFSPDGRDIRPEKENVENKIDPIVSLILAFQCWQECSILPQPMKAWSIGIKTD